MYVIHLENIVIIYYYTLCTFLTLSIHFIHYWYRLENLDSNFTLLKDAYEESKKLFEIKIPSWHGSITLLIKNHVEHDIRKCFSLSISPDVQRR
jgi:hypothetical protein